MNTHHTINYIEFPATDIAATKAFYSTCFGWTFTDYGPDYVAFSDGHMDGGFTTDTTGVATGLPLIILYADALEQTKEDIKKAGGTIVKDIYSFPGGRRFHFTDPNNNELAVWGK